jgi:hypothetical protein
MNAHHTSNHKLKRGYHPAATLTQQDAIVNWPRQVDQTWHKWKPPVDGGRIFQAYAQLPRGLDGHGSPQGQGSFDFRLAGLTPAMAGYLRATIFDNNAIDAFTVETWDRFGSWRILHCVGSLGMPQEQGEIGYRSGFSIYTIAFVVKREAP